MKLLILSIATGYCLSGAVASAQTATNVICTSCVGETDIANQAVTSAKIADGTIKTADIRVGAITSDRILNGTVSSNDLSPQLQDLLDSAIVDITIQRVASLGRRRGGRGMPVGPHSASLRLKTARVPTARAISACCSAARFPGQEQSRHASTKRGASIRNCPRHSRLSGQSASAQRPQTVRHGFRPARDSRPTPEMHPTSRPPSRRLG